MIVTRSNARRIIRKYYDDAFKIRITTSCTIGLRPVYDPRPTLAWRSLTKGSDSAVHIGQLMPGNDIDWTFAG